MDSQMIICLVIFALTMVSYVTRFIPMSVTALASMLLMILTGCLDASTALSTLSNNNSIIIIGMMIIAAGFAKTTFVNTICDAILRFFGGQFKKAYLAMLVATALIVGTSGGALSCFAMMYPLMMNICRRCNVSPSKAMYGILLICVSCLTSLPLTASVSIGAQINGYLTSFGYEELMTPITFFKATFPTMVIVVLYGYFVLPKLMPDLPLTELAASTERSDSAPQLKPFANVAGLVLFIVNIAGMMLSSKIGVPSHIICLSCAVLMLICGTLTEAEAVKAVPVSMLALYIGANACAAALTGTGAAQLVGDLMASIMGGTHNGYVIGLLFFLFPFVLTQFMNNGSVMQLFTPICIMTCASLGANMTGPLILVQSACTTAFLSPMATPSVPLCMGVAGYEQKHLFKMGLPISVILVVFEVFYIMTLFPAF